MRVIGLTGGIACGKSTVSKHLTEKRGVPVIDCDLIAREVVQPGKPAFKRIVETFGEEVLKPNKELNRLKLGEIIFNDVEKRRQLTTITGPMIFLEITKQILWHFCLGTPFVVIDAPTLYESKHLLNIVAQVIVVGVSEEVQVKRMMKRDGLSEEQAHARLNAQLPLEEKVKRAHHVIWNEGSLEDLVVKVDQVVDKAESKFKYGPSRLLSLPGISIMMCAIFAGIQLVKH